MRASPLSAKAILSRGTLYGTMDPVARLALTRHAVELAPEWPMANVYLGDSLCLMGRVGEAWPHYAKGFSLGPRERDLVAMGLQCMWDHGALAPASPLWAGLNALGNAHPDTWLDVLVQDVRAHGAVQGGVDPRYKARAFDEGPAQQ
jgi:predicted TPR repeat methyltransferase